MGRSVAHPSALPSVEEVLAAADGAGLAAIRARSEMVAAVRAEIDRLRASLLEGGRVDAAALEPPAVAAAAAARVDASSRRRLAPVVNATGIVIHTNLGRAAMAEEAARAAYDAARGAVALEMDLDSGRRGQRDHVVEGHLRALSGAEAAAVVNNNAAAVVLALATVAAGREVLVSRGELVEIGGSFRIPEIIEAAGARLREVGTTNRTHPGDYERAVGPQTAAILKVHTSNYRVVGFTASVEAAALAAIARRADLPLVEDLGSGALIDTTLLGLPHEPEPRRSLEAGVDLVTFSGDKLAGGPQCGVLAGSVRWVERARRHPLRRALRCDKMTLAALEATLGLLRFAPDPVAALPALRALARPEVEVRAAAERAATLLAVALGTGFALEVVTTEARVGSGAQPTIAIPSAAVAVTSDTQSADALARRFRMACPGIVGRVERDRLLLDLRAVERPEDLVPSWAGAGG